jgi:hypothetical protein
MGALTVPVDIFDNCTLLNQRWRKKPQLVSRNCPRSGPKSGTRCRVC